MAPLRALRHAGPPSPAARRATRRDTDVSIEELNRTNIQALWRHMPGQPYNWPRKATVVGDNPKQVSPLDVPEGWVAPQLRRLVRPFAEAVSGAPNVGNELAIIDGLLFELVKAED